MRRLISSISRQRRLSVMKYRSWSRKARRKSSMLKIKENIPLAPLTTFEIGGTARYMTEARKDDDIREATRWAKEKNVRLVGLAGGSNVLVPDEGLDALVVRLVGNLYSVSDGVVDAWAGTNLLVLVRALGAQGYGGGGELAGISRTIGGAGRGNAGAVGPGVKDFVTSGRALNNESGEGGDFTNAECAFLYRHSFF